MLGKKPLEEGILSFSRGGFPGSGHLGEMGPPGADSPCRLGSSENQPQPAPTARHTKVRCRQWGRLPKPSFHLRLQRGALLFGSLHPHCQLPENLFTHWFLWRGRSRYNTLCNLSPHPESTQSKSARRGQITLLFLYLLVFFSFHLFFLPALATLLPLYFGYPRDF